MKEIAMNRGKHTAWIVLGMYVGLLVLAGAAEAYAQAPAAGGTPGDTFFQQTKATAKNGWTILSTIGTVVVGGGALISLAAGMYKGNWGQAAISFVAGAAGLMALWGIGQTLNF
jgi:hypothetical protein